MRALKLREDPIAAPEPSSYLNLMVQLVDGARTIQDAFHALMSAKGIELGLAEYRLLAVLFNIGPVHHGDLSARVHLKKRSLSGTIRRLELRNLIEQNVPSHDRRFRCVGLTELGKDTVERASRALAESKFDIEDISGLKTSLNAFRRWLSELHA